MESHLKGQLTQKLKFCHTHPVTKSNLFWYFKRYFEKCQNEQMFFFFVFFFSHSYKSMRSKMYEPLHYFWKNYKLFNFFSWSKDRSNIEYVSYSVSKEISTMSQNVLLVYQVPKSKI